MSKVTPFNNELVHLAQAVTEADDNSIPTLLLDLNQILERSRNEKEKALLLAQVWQYQFPDIIITALKQDFSEVRGDWNTACQLTSALVQCLHAGSICTEDYPIQATFLILQNALKIVDKFSRGKDITQYDGERLLGCLSLLVGSLYECNKTHTSTTITALSSKYFLQFLMVEDDRVSMVALACLKNIIKVNKGAFYHIAESRVHSIADELAFKLTSTKHPLLAKVTVATLTLLLDVHPALMTFFSSKQYKGFKEYVVKWKGKGLDFEVERLTGQFNRFEQMQKQSQKMELEAVKIQSVYRGYRARKCLNNAHRAINRLKRVCVARKHYREKQAKEQMLQNVLKDHVDKTRRKTFVESKIKTLQAIGNIPASTVDSFFKHLQTNSAVKIQAVWRSYKTRRFVKRLLPAIKKEKAAILIQRAVRRWLVFVRKRRKEAMTELLPEGLTDERKCQLQTVVANIRERFQVNNVTDERLNELHSKGFAELNHHMARLCTVRRRDQHRKALMAQLAVQNQQFNLLPPLHGVTTEHVERLESYSTPVAVAARAQHEALLKKLNRPWWKKLGDEEEENMLFVPFQHEKLF